MKSIEAPVEVDSEFYDYFYLSISDINLSLNTFHNVVPLLEQFEVTLNLAKCKDPLEPTLAMFKIQGNTSEIIGELTTSEWSVL